MGKTGSLSGHDIGCKVRILVSTLTQGPGFDDPPRVLVSKTKILVGRKLGRCPLLEHGVLSPRCYLINLRFGSWGLGVDETCRHKPRVVTTSTSIRYIFSSPSGNRFKKTTPLLFLSSWSFQELWFL